MDSATDFDITLSAQKIFKGIMNAFSHPLQVYSVSDGMGGNPLTRGEDAAITDLCCTFLDNTVSFYVHGSETFTGDLQELTYARPALIEEAGFVIVRDIGGFDQWDKVYQGTLLDPHKGATVIIETPRLDGETEITAEGPGINGSLKCSVDRAIAECLRRIAALDIEYPKGFEVMFVTRQGDMFAVPRHVKIYGEGF